MFLWVKRHSFSRKTATVTVLSFPMEFDIPFWTKREPEHAELSGVNQKQQSQSTKNPEIQKTRNPENLEFSDMSSAASEPLSQ